MIVWSKQLHKECGWKRRRIAGGRNSRFHFRAEAPPLPRFNSCSVSEAAILHLIDWSEFGGARHGALHVEAVKCMLPVAGYQNGNYGSIHFATDTC
jgi:hypothetical protein